MGEGHRRTQQRLVVIGGSDAGIEAALRARELSPETNVAVLVADEYPNFSLCGLPFLFSGEVPDWRSLAHRTLEELESTGVRLSLSTRASGIDPSTRVISAESPAGAVVVEYDRLVVATGALPMRPAIAGLDQPGVHVLHDMHHAFDLLRGFEQRKVQDVLIIGAGYLGLEMADALRHAGVGVGVVASGPQPMPSVDAELGTRLAERMRAGGVRLATGIRVRGIERRRDVLVVRGDPGFEASAPLVVVVTGVVPNAALGRAAGATEGVRGALRVDDRTQTSIDGILAAGDCVETWHRLLRRRSYLPLGTTAHKQGRVAGDNAVGGDARYAGTLGTQVIKVFGSVVGRTGLRHDEAAREGFEPLTIEIEAWDHKLYFPGATKLWIRLTADRVTRRLLGAQLLGAAGAEVSKRLDVLATALHNEMQVEQLTALDLSYAPPLSSPWDPVQLAALQWARARRAQVGAPVP